MNHKLNNQPTDCSSTAVVILNWNGSALLRRFLPSVISHTIATGARIVVADNGSTDDSLSLLERDFPEVEVMAFDRNYGFAEGYNRAIAAIDTTYAVLLNSDAATPEGWLQPLVEFMDSHSNAGACQPKILSAENPSVFEYAGAAGGYLDRNGYPYCRGRVFSTIEADRGQYDDTAEVMWASGAALMVRQKAYLDTGGLDKIFFAHMEEIDLCWRMRLRGWKVYAVGNSSVHHLGGGSLPASDPKKTYLNFRNNLLMLHRNLPDRVRRKRLIVRRLLDAVAWLRYAATMQWADAAAIIRAHRDYRKMKAGLTDINGSGADLLRSTPEAKKNVLAAYYLRGKHTFRSIIQS